MKVASLQDKVVLITGAGRAPAPILAQALAEHGAVLALNDLSPVLLDPLAESLRPFGTVVHTYPADATRGMPLRALLDQILEDLGRIDILINNPRIQPDTLIEHMDEWDWQRTIEMNLNGPFLTTQLVARLMQEQGGGLIFNIVDTDPATLTAPGHAAYAASQTGFLTLSQAAARELMTYNIRVYALCPGTALLTTPTPSYNPAPEAMLRLQQRMLSLCSPEAEPPDGQVISVE